MKTIYLILILSFSGFFFTHQYSAENHFLYLGRFLSRPVEAVIFKSFGMKDQYADLLYIRMLQYYGKKELYSNDYLSGNYSLMYQKVRDISIVDGGYKNAVLLGSSILAFGLNRTWEAKSLLKIAMLERIPPRVLTAYAVFLAAIVTYENRKGIIDEHDIILLYKIAMDKESSDLLKNVVAFLCEKNKRMDLAYNIYKTIVENSTDKSYIMKAKMKIEKLKRYDNIKIY